MKKLVIGSTMSVTFFAIMILMSSFFTSLFSNLGTAIEKTFDTGNPQYLAKVGDDSWNDLCATVNSMPLISDIKGLLEKNGADGDMLNQVTGTQKVTSVNKPDVNTVNKIAEAIGTDSISQEQIDEIYNTQILTDEEYEKIAEETDTGYDEFFDNLFADK